MLKFLLRLTLVGLAFYYALPRVYGVEVHAEILGVLALSLIFNLIFFVLEWLLTVIVVGINIGTLGIGQFFTSFLRFAATLLAPSAALYATARLMPQFLHVSGYYPPAIVGGLVLGGILWATSPPGNKPR